MASLNPARPGTGFGTSARSRPATRPTCSSSPDLESFVPELVLKARPAGRGDPPRPRGARLGAAHRAHPQPSASNRFPHPLGRRSRMRVIGLVPDQIVTESLVEEPTVVDGLAVADPERDLAKIAVIERHLGTGPDRTRLRARLRAAAAARSPRRSRTTRTTSSWSGWTTTTWRGRSPAWPRLGGGSRRGRGPAACARSCRCRSPACSRRRRSTRSSRRATACVEAARALGCQLPSPFQIAVVPGALGDPEPQDHRPRARRRRPLRARPAARRLMATLLTNAWVVTMDDAGTEHADGWVLVEDGLVDAVGDGAPPDADERVDLGGALVTPGLVNTHHHLYQTLTRARAQEADLFTWLQDAVSGLGRHRRRGRVRGRAHRARRARARRAARPSSTTTTSSRAGETGLIEAEVQAARELGVRLVASRGSMDLGRVGRRPAARRARRGAPTTCSPTPSAWRASCTSPARALACRSRSRRARRSR